MAWLYKQKGSANWWIGYRLNGRQVLRSTGTSDKTEAQKELAKLDQLATAKRNGNLTEEFYRALIGAETKQISLKLSAQQWLESLKGTTADSTFKRYGYAVQPLLEHFNATDAKPLLSDIGTPEVRAFLTAMHSRQSASSTNQARKILSIFFKFNMDAGHIRANPVKQVKRFKESVASSTEAERRPFSTDELSKVFKAAPDDFWRFMVRGGLYTGLRLGDLACLQRKEVLLESNQLKLEANKTGKQLTIPLAAPFREVLEKRLNELGRGKATDFLWPEQASRYITKGASGLSNQFYDRILVEAKLAPKRKHRKKSEREANDRRTPSEVSFHSFRHSFVSLLKLSGASQHVAKELAGHHSDAVSDLYTSIPIDVLTKAVQQLPEVAS